MTRLTQLYRGKSAFCWRHPLIVCFRSGKGNDVIGPRGGQILHLATPAVMAVEPVRFGATEFGPFDNNFFADQEFNRPTDVFFVHVEVFRDRDLGESNVVFKREMSEQIV